MSIEPKKVALRAVGLRAGGRTTGWQQRPRAQRLVPARPPGKMPSMIPNRSDSGRREDRGHRGNIGGGFWVCSR